MLLAGGILLDGVPAVHAPSEELQLSSEQLRAAVYDCAAACQTPAAVLDDIKVQVYRRVWVRPLSSSRIVQSAVASGSSLSSTAPFELGTTTLLSTPCLRVREEQQLQDARPFDPESVFLMFDDNMDGQLSLRQTADLLAVWYDFGKAEQPRKAVKNLRRLLAEAFASCTRPSAEDRLSWEQVRSQSLFACLFSIG